MGYTYTDARTDARIDADSRNFTDIKPVSPVVRDLRVRYYDLKNAFCDLYKEASNASLNGQAFNEHDEAYLNRIMFNCAKILDFGMTV